MKKLQTNYNVQNKILELSRETSAMTVRESITDPSFSGTPTPDLNSNNICDLNNLNLNTNKSSDQSNP